MERYRQMGVVDIVTKPFQLEHLLQIVRGVVGRA
jgi:DNA-binding response OmpR family regulator